MKIGSDAGSRAFHAELAEKRRIARELAARPPKPPRPPGRRGPTTFAPETTQAMRIVYKLGGPYRLAALLGKHPTTIYKWLWLPPHGTGGRIPAISVVAVIQAAHTLGVVLTEEDWGLPPWMVPKEEFDPIG